MADDNTPTQPKPFQGATFDINVIDALSTKANQALANLNGLTGAAPYEQPNTWTSLGSWAAQFWLLLVSLALLATLLVLRFVWPELVVKQSIAYALSITWPFPLFFWLGLLSDLPRSGHSFSFMLTFSTAIFAGTTSVVLKLGFFYTAPTKQSIEMFCIITTAILIPIWTITVWRVNRKRLLTRHKDFQINQAQN